MKRDLSKPLSPSEGISSYSEGKMSENEIRLRRRKAQAAQNAKDRVSRLEEDKAYAKGRDKDSKAGRIQNRIDRTSNRGKRRVKAATAGRTDKELRSIGIEPPKAKK
tara:strand:+ start:475 stop:795 length:321 start_codon:yes stop_codon:yes gene_type:complete